MYALRDCCDTLFSHLLLRKNGQLLLVSSIEVMQDDSSPFQLLDA